jgi:hypothetical protein
MEDLARFKFPRPGAKQKAGQTNVKWREEEGRWLEMLSILWGGKQATEKEQKELYPAVFRECLRIAVELLEQQRSGGVLAGMEECEEPANEPPQASAAKATPKPRSRPRKKGE